MNAIDSVTLIVAIILAGLGLVLGFGRTLKFFTKGIFGFILSIFICASFGGMIACIPAVAGWIRGLNAQLGEAWSFLGTIRLATVIYYVVLFFAVQLVRILVVKVIAGLFSADVLPVRIINRVLGAALMVAAVLLLVLLAFAIVAIFGETQGVIDFVAEIDDTFLGALYAHNPIKFIA